MNNSKVIIIGLDGATFDLVIPWTKSGYLPNISKLLRNGYHSNLSSVTPTISPAAWATFMTGSNPGKHGVYDFVYLDKDSYQLKPVTRMNIAIPSIWRLLCDQGKKVISINVPITYPPEPIDGIIISGLGTPNGSCFTYPVEFSEYLNKNNYFVNRRIYYTPGKERDFLQDTRRIIDNLTSTTIKLLNNNSWDCATVVYRETDTVAHHFWHMMDINHPMYIHNSPYQNAILDTYKHIDASIGLLISKVNDYCNIFIISDHGMGPLYQDVYLNEVLRQNNYLITKKNYFLSNLLGRIGLNREVASQIIKNKHIANLSKTINNILKNKLGSGIQKYNWTDFDQGINWEKTKAFSYGYQGQIYIHKKNSYHKGIIDDVEYDDVLDQLVNLFSNIIDPSDNKPVVDKISYQQEIFSGPYSQFGPDLVLNMRNLSYTSRLYYELSSKNGEILSKPQGNDYAGHRLEGILIASGNDIVQRMSKGENAWLGDIAPTVLYLLNCSIPKWMDGKILEHLLTPNTRRRQPSYSNDVEIFNKDFSYNLEIKDEQDLMERLKNLGYLT